MEHTASSDLKTFTVTLVTDEIAPFVFLNLRDSTHGRFSDNGFIMVDSQQVVTYESRDPISLHDFITQLDIMSLYDVTAVAQD